MHIIEKIFRNRTFWILIVMAFYLSGVFAIGIYILATPFVIPHIPLGLYRALFPSQEIGQNDLPPFYRLFQIAYYVVFGGLFMYYLSSIKHLKSRTLYALGIVLILIMLLTLKGCMNIPGLLEP